MNQSYFSTAMEILTFESGILGFEEIKQYILYYLDDELPFYYLRALGKDHPCFVVCDPLCFVPDYTVRYDDETLRELGARSPEDMRCLAIATIPEDPTNITVNLRSPVIFNISNGMAKQYVTDNTKYTIRHRLFNKAVDKAC